MDGKMSMSHELVNPDSLAPPVGFAHAVATVPGRTVYLGGQVGHGPDGRLVGPGLVEQFDQAAANIVEALRAAGGLPEHIVSMQVFGTDAAAYRASLRELGEAWKRRFGRHYPALAFFEIKGLFDPEAKVELMAISVIPDGH
jgi:enamine deaminase RidA (YjgF/YER057c/UK114 family)